MKLTYHLHSNQGIVYLSESRFNVLAAGRRFGKTILALVKLVVFALSHNESYIWYVAPTYRQAKTIAWRLLKKIAPEVEFKGKPNESELQIVFRNGSIIELKGADNEDSLRGSGLDGIVVDEFATIYNNWAVWYEVLRPSLTDKNGWALFISTPKGKDAFFELFLKGQRGEDGFSSFQFKTEDNPYIDKAEIEAARKELPDHFFKQEYEASFEDYVGLVYPEFNPVHIIDPFYIPQIYSRIGAIDPAISGTTGVLKCAVDEDGDLIFYEEYYEKNVRVSEVAGCVRQEGVRWFIDPASKAKLSQKEGMLYSLYDEYTDVGIVSYPGENDVEAGINRVGEYFKTNKIKIFSTCTKLIWELERYHYAESRETLKGDTKASPYKKNDHLCDCLRYIIMSRTSKTELPREDANPLSAWGKAAMIRKKREEYVH